jgi:hypothetical protein
LTLGFTIGFGSKIMPDLEKIASDNGLALHITSGTSCPIGY